MRKIIQQLIDEHADLVEKLRPMLYEKIEQASVLLIETLKNGGTVFLCGNGGSAADAQHIAGEFVGRFRRERKPLAAIALSTDTSILTALGNDYSFDIVFSRQLEGLGGEGDLLWAFSTSGRSSNVLRAAETAKQMQMNIISFTGCSDSELEKQSDVCIAAAAESTFQAQQIHQIAYHIICELVESELVKTDGQ